MSDPLQLHRLQHTRLPCPTPSPRTCSNSCPWVGDAIQPSHPLHPLFLLPSNFPSIRVFSNESALCIRWPKYWSFSFNISHSNEHPGLISLGWTGWISWQSKGLSRVFSNATVWKHQFFSAFFIAQLSHPYITTRITFYWNPELPWKWPGYPHATMLWGSPH